MIKKLLLTITFAALASCLYAQGTVTGKVFDDASATTPLPGASVLVKGTTNGTTADANGEFTLANVPPDGTLVISFIGYINKEIAVNNQSDFQITLASDVTSLGEVVVIGYGTLKKSDLTSAISSINGKALQGRPVQSTQELLQGQAAGVTVTSDGGEPGGGVKVRIRGVGSFGNNDPLYIVDGIPVNHGLNYLNPNDIESMEVFKDAAAAAIYGNRAANGVIYVTTKKGKTGTKQVTFDAYYGFAKNGKMQKLADADEYMKYVTLKGMDANYQSLYAAGNNVDWTKEVTRTAITQNYNVGISGGTENQHYFTSIGYSKAQGTHAYSDNERITARLNSDYKVFKWLKFTEALTITNEKRHSLNTFGQARRTPPVVPVYKTDAEIQALRPEDRALDQFYDVTQGVGWGQNQRGVIARANNVRNWFTINGNVQGDVDFGTFTKTLDGLKFTSTFGFERINEDGNSFNPIYSLGSKDYSPRTSTGVDFAKDFHWTFNNFLSYNKTFGKHTIGLTAGVVGEEQKRSWINASGSTGISNSEYLQVIDAMTEQRNNGGSAFRTAYSSKVGRLTYNYNDRYLLQASIRSDGSYRFAPGKRHGSYPSVSGAWRLSNEDFFKNINSNSISDIKIRAGWGQLGNDIIPVAFQYLNTIAGTYDRGYILDGVGGGNASYKFSQGYGPNTAVNPILTWETTRTVNVGVDVGAFDNKVTFSFDYFNRHTTNVLFQKKLPYYSGFPTDEGIPPVKQWVNGAEIVSRGFDFNLGYNNTFGDLGFDANVNLSSYKPKVTKIADQNPIAVNDERIPLVVSMKEGDPVGAFFGYVNDGFFNTTAELTTSDGKEVLTGAQVGDFKFKDFNGDGVINSLDKRVIGNPNPKFTYSLNLNFSYKGFDLKTFWYGVYGNDIYKIGEIYFNGWDESNSPQNIYAGVVDNSWTDQNHNAKFPKISPGSTKRNYERAPTSSSIQSGSFFRLKNLQIGYTIPCSALTKLGIQSLRVYVSAENVFVLTKYKGGDPEVGGGVSLNANQGGRAASPGYIYGLDYGDRYPIQKTLAAGLNIKF